VELDAGTLVFDVCLSEDGGFASPALHRQGTRALTAAERAGLDSQIANVRADAAPLPCASDGPVLEFDVTTAFGAQVSLIDLESLDPPACLEPTARQRVNGGWPLVSYLERLVR
jgi:hypothetical protein